MVFRRILYFVYYLRHLDRRLLDRFMAHVERENGWSRWQQWRRILRDSFKFNVSILEYYQFRFYQLLDDEKSSWAGTGTMYEFQRSANPPDQRWILEDKREFYAAYSRFFRHGFFTLDQLQNSPETLGQLLRENSELVLKEATGNCGRGVKFLDTRGLSADELLDQMESNNFDVLETRLKQHRELDNLSPSGVNTIRIFTIIRESGDYEVLGCRLRISIDSRIDNLAAGNMAAPVNPDSGVVTGPGVFSDITRRPQLNHPVTGRPVKGFQIPFWPETLNLVREASLLFPQNRSVGWDVAITDEGPGLIEGNHDWCKLVWQLPVGRGLKARLELVD